MVLRRSKERTISVCHVLSVCYGTLVCFEYPDLLWLKSKMHLDRGGRISTLASFTKASFRDAEEEEEEEEEEDDDDGTRWHTDQISINVSV